MFGVDFFYKTNFHVEIKIYAITSHLKLHTNLKITDS